MPVRSVRYRARRGVIRVFNFRGQEMKQLLLAGVALSVATAASAADMQARPYTKAPPAIVSPAYNWSGFYVGAMGGYGWGTDAGSGGFGGGTVGYNWQFPGSQFVFGVEVDAAGASIKDSFTEDVDVGVLTQLTQELQDQCIRKRDRPCRLRDGCGAALRQGRFCVGQQQDHPFTYQSSAYRIRIATLIPAIRSAAVSNICSRRTGRPRPSTCTPASAARTTIC